MPASRSSFPVAVQGLMSHRDSTLGRLCAQAGELSRIDDLLRSLLPEPLSRHVRTCAMRGATLVLQTDSPVWSVRLRLEQQRLVARLRATSDFAHIAGLRITVAAPAVSREPRPRPPRLSAAAAETLARCAESQTDPALQASLARLSRRG
jgi:hypothetical protein